MLLAHRPWNFYVYVLATFILLIFFQLHEDKLIQAAETTKVTQARNLALAKEKLRAQQVASLPPPVKPDLKQLLNKAKAAYVQVCGIRRVMNGIIYVTHALYYG